MKGAGEGPTPSVAPPPEPGSPAGGGLSTGGVLVTASLILTVAALASRLLGWIRLLVIGSQFGASRELDAYFAAFRIPDAIFQLVVAGALSAALIPVFSSYRARGEEAEAWQLASSVINLVLIALAAFSLLMAIFAPVLVPIVAPGFDAPTTELTIRMTRVMLISPVLIGMGAVVTGILNSYQQFTVPAIAPLVYNLAIIFAAIFLAPIMGVEGLAVGVAIGSLAHLAVQLPNLARVGQRYDLTIGLSHPGVRRVAWLMGPRTLGLAAGQINFLVSTVLASGLPEGSLTAYNYAFQLSQIPVGVIGVSIAVALFPTLSQDAALGRIGEIRRQVAGAVRVLIFVAAPLTAIMIVLREPLTSVFYQYGLFSQSATDRTASTLLFFALGLVGHIVVHVLARAFYAMQDTKTPVAWAIMAVAINVPLMALLVGPMGVEGLALALSISSVLEVIGLLWFLRRRIESVDESAIIRTVGAIRGCRAGRGAADVRWPDARRDLACWHPREHRGTTPRAPGPLRRRRSHLPAGRGGAALARAGPAPRHPVATAPEERVIQFRPATEADADAWQTFLAATGSGDFLHDWAWADVAAFDGQPQRRYVLTDDEAIVALVAAQERPLVAGRAFWYVPHGPVLDWERAGGCGASARAAHRPAHRGKAASRHRGQARAAHRAAGRPRLGAAARLPTRARHPPGRADSDRGACRRRGAAGRLRQGHAVCRAPRRTRGGRGDGGRGRQRLARHRRPPWPGRRDAAARRLPAATARAIPGGVARAGRRRTGRHPRGASRWRAARLGHGRLRGHRARTTCSAAPAARSAASRSTTPAMRCSGR